MRHRDRHPDRPDVMVAFRGDLGPLEACVGPRVGTITVPSFRVTAVPSVLDVPIPPSIDGAPLTSRVGDTARSTVASSDSR